MLDGLRSKQGGKTGQSRGNSNQSGSNSDVDHRQKSNKLKDFYKSIKNSSVVSKGHQMQEAANQRTPVLVSVTKSIREIAAEILDFIPADKYAEINPLVNNLVFGEVPTTLDQLEAFAATANELYAFVDYKLTDESVAGDKYKTSLSNWRSDFKKELYNLRDELLQNEEGSLSRFGMESQFRKLHPGAQIPSLLTERQNQLGVIVFGASADNDCGAFASRLLGELEGETMRSLWQEIERGNIKDDELKDVFRDLLKNGPRKDTLRYKKDAAFAFGHHAKTSIGSYAGKTYSLEAHVGKPFILAPELREFNSLDEYLEMDDEYIEHRSNAGPNNDYGSVDLSSTDILTIKGWIKSAALRESIKPLGRKGF
ncbi:hypothetical protein [Spirosoma flavum]|uniref:Uncharacterized protein n=1 Tax=Spirosoma flavum TaxID=2048557 RepID=A0ABW6AI99_9BACT